MMTEPSAEMILVGDIGGSNARFALQAKDAEDLRLQFVEVLPCHRYGSLQLAIETYLKRLPPATAAAVSAACLAVASTLDGQFQGAELKLTNNPWRFEPNALRAHFEWTSFKLINDFAAMALGVPHVQTDKLIYVCGGGGDSTRARLMIGPGTGLGVSGLVPTRNGWLPLPGEGGHVDFAPGNEVEMEVLHRLRVRFGRVSAERLLSGDGLVNLYLSLAQMRDYPVVYDAAKQITVAALEYEEPLAVEALERFCQILGRTAGNAALTLGSLGGVFLCGGIVSRFPEFLIRSGFQGAFLDKGRMRPLLQSIPVHIVADSYAGLLGAAEASRNPEV